MNPDAVAEFKLLRRELEQIQAALLSFEAKYARRLERLHPEFLQSGINLLHYLCLRGFDLRDLQLRLSRFGLSSLGRSELYVLSNVQETLARVCDSLSRARVGESMPISPARPALNWLQGEEILHRHTRAAFGPRPRDRHVYVMVTAPCAAEVTPEWAVEVLRAGANLVRINCAHESRAQWESMASTIQAASAALKLPCKLLVDLPGPKIRVKAPKKTVLRLGDRVELRSHGRTRGKEGAVIVCSPPEVLRDVRAGHRVLFDDGKIEAEVESAEKARCRLRITRVPNGKAKLRHEKGINFPDTDLRVDEVSEEDLRDLSFAAEHADLVGLSFAQKPAAIRKVRSRLKRLGRADLGLVLKIETRLGFRALPRLLLEAMSDCPVAVMIARGDLAVEVGFERMVEVQEEILWLCEAAHVPVIWATQVLETLAKSGLPSRAEVTDAGAGVRAECVMLNKGEHIVQAVASLVNIITRMERHVYKKRNLYRELDVARL